MEQGFYIDGEVIPSIVEKPVKSLDRRYYSTLSDRGQVSELGELIKAISTIACPVDRNCGVCGLSFCP